MRGKCVPDCQMQMRDAIRNGDAAKVTYFLGHGYDVNGSVVTLGAKQTALHMAVICGQLGVVKALISRGAEVNALNSLSQTPLVIACERVWNSQENYDILLTLLESGAHVSVAGYTRWTIDAVVNMTEGSSADTITPGPKRTAVDKLYDNLWGQSDVSKLRISLYRDFGGNYYRDQLAKLTRLTKLRATFVNSRIPRDFPYSILQFTSTLKSLTLFKPGLDVEAAKNICANTSLTHLHINEFGSTPSINAIKSLATSTSITELKLTNCHAVDAAAACFSAMTSLTTLSLGRNYIRDPGAIDLSRSTTIETLLLFSNQIGNKGCRALARNTTLTRLDLDSNYIGTKGFICFADNTTLTELECCGQANIIDTESIEAFERNTTLLSLGWGCDMELPFINRNVKNADSKLNMVAFLMRIVSETKARALRRRR